jgi:hypothetical protein
MSGDTPWLLVRPVLRLLLWLIPEHVPLPLASATMSSSQAVKETLTTFKDDKQTKPTGSSVDWQQEVAQAFVAEVATVSPQHPAV